MQNKSGRKLHSLKEVYTITMLAFRTMPKLKEAKKKNEIDQQFMERIMLAVTEVNGCAVCSYAHTKMALEAGLSDTEIKNMLAGISDDTPAQEIQAIMFAQHYADSRGVPSKKSWERVVETYGLPKAEGILGAIRVIMMGNVYGIPWSSFFNRLKGKPDKRSSLSYELRLMACSILFVPIAFIHALISKKLLI
ncbi:MAG: carboxymuconolactone decarboxylase family protein [Sedimentibacter sp.]